jgi:Uma2 family endonuclease
VATDTTITLDQVHRMGLAEYHQLIDAGGFDEGARIELIHGLLLDMSPKSYEHEATISWLTVWLARAIDTARYRLGVGWPLTLEPQLSEPEPDFIVFPVDTPRKRHPVTADLVIEVSVSSLARDLGVKPGLYARAGVGEYWVIDVQGRRIVRHREPETDGYRRIDELREGVKLVASAVRLPPLDTRELFAAAHA